jgi:hypothetical protein
LDEPLLYGGEPLRIAGRSAILVRMSSISRFTAIVMLAVSGTALAADPAVGPLKNAHAHNDYEHARPLFDALDQGFNSVEADVFLVDGKLLVGHTRFDLKSNRTLESLYLDPLRERVRANGGRLYKDGPPAWLLVDVKTDANPTYAALHDVLAKYADILTTVDEGRVDPKAITVVVSGNMAKEAMGQQTRRYAAYDGRAGDVNSDLPVHLMPWVSDNWTKLFQWRGEGKMSGEERAKLRDFVANAHKHGRLVRFWGTPEKPAFWAELRAADVDLINTDQLAALRRFLVGRPLP